MKPFIALALAFSFVGNFSVRAQSDMIILQRARNLQNVVNPQPGNAAPTAPAPPPAPAAPPSPVVSPVNAQMKGNLDMLAADLTTMKSGTPITNELKQTLEADFATLAIASVRPSPASLTNLADDLCAALSGQNLSSADRSQLAQSVNGVVNSSLYPAAQTKSFVAVAQTSLKSCGVSDASVKTVATDLNAILDEVQKKKPKLYQ